MPVDLHSHQPRQGFSGFGGRIILIVLSIITLSQVLGTFLSVLSFEKIFFKALTYKYEILGKELKRKIEQSLKFGKPLDRFLGMDKLVEPLFRQSDDLNEIFISDAKGKIFFTFGKVEFVVGKGAVDEKEHPRGKIILGNFKKKEDFPAEELFDWQEKGTVIRLLQGRYHVMFPIIPRYGNQRGILGLVFKKSVLDEKKQELIRSSRNKLAAAICVTAILVGLLIRFLFVAPARRQVGLAADIMGKPATADKIEQIEVPKEVMEIHDRMKKFIARARQTKNELSVSLDDLEQATSVKGVPNHEIELMKEILEKREDDEI